MKVVIIGGGVAGLSIGLRLVQAKCEVTVLERAQPGRGATWASGGMIAAGAEHADADPPEAQLARHSASLWPDFAAEIERLSRREIFYRRMGSLIVGHAEGSSGESPNGMTVISAAEARKLEPLLSSEIGNALFAADDAQVDNRALGLALALAFVSVGGTLQVNEAVVRFEMEKDRIFGARTPFALYTGDIYIIAAGAWSGELAGIPPQAIAPIIPVKGEMLALEPPDAAALPTHLIWGDGVYLIPRHRRLFVGATVSKEGFDTALSKSARSRLQSNACALMPALKDWPIVEHWAGLRPGSPDDLPVLGETAVKGLFVASGQYRNGILYAPAVAEAMQSLVLEQRAPREVDAFTPRRFANRAVESASSRP